MTILGGPALPVYLANGTQIGGAAQPVVLVDAQGVPLVNVTVSAFGQTLLDDATAEAMLTTLGIGNPGIASLPATPVQRNADSALGANNALGTPISVHRTVKVRRARLRVAVQSGQLDVGLYDTAFAKIVAAGATQCGPAGAMQLALPPTSIPAGAASLWASADNGTATIAVNSAQGDVQGSMLKATSHPLPSSFTGVATNPLAACIQVMPDDPTPLSATRPYSRTDINVSVLGLSASRLYGISTVNGHWVYSDDGTAWTDTGESPAVNPGNAFIIQLVNHSTFLIAVTSDGKLYRVTKDTWTGWTDISVPGLPAGTTGRIDVLASNGTNLYYGNYNASTPGGAKIYRSVDNGANWTNVLDAPTARHVHAIYVDPNSAAKAFATLGDSGQAGNGLYYSGDSGATWARISSNRYGIDLFIPTAVSGVPVRLLIEGDGAAQPHIMSAYYNLASVGTALLTDALIWPDTAPSSGASWAGTARGLAVTTDNNLVYVSTAESGAVGTRDGWWIARGPWYDTPILLEELTGAVPAAYQKTYIYGSAGVAFNYRYKFVLPKFAGQ